MNKCLLCGCDTNGSIGAAGISWPMICQVCKNSEDEAVIRKIQADKRVYETVHDLLDNRARLVKKEGNK